MSKAAVGRLKHIRDAARTSEKMREQVSDVRQSVPVLNLEDEMKDEMREGGLVGAAAGAGLGSFFGLFIGSSGLKLDTMSPGLTWENVDTLLSTVVTGAGMGAVIGSFLLIILVWSGFQTDRNRLPLQAPRPSSRLATMPLKRKEIFTKHKAR